MSQNVRSQLRKKYFFHTSLLLTLTAFIITACVSSVFNGPRTPANDEVSIPGSNTSPEPKNENPLDIDASVSSAENSAKGFRSNSKSAGPLLAVPQNENNEGFKPNQQRQKASPEKQRNRRALKTIQKDPAKPRSVAKLKSTISERKESADRQRNDSQFYKNKNPNKKANLKKTKDYLKQNGAKPVNKGQSGRNFAQAQKNSRNIAQENLCNSVQYEAFPDLNFALASSERLRSVSFSVDNSYIAVTQNPVIGTQFFYYKNLGDDVTNDIFDYFDEVGVKPSLAKLNPSDRNRHVAIYGANGFSTTYPRSSEVYRSLDRVNQQGYYINDVALGSETDSIVIIYRYDDVIENGDFSGYSGYNIPGELFDELEFLYNSREMVHKVAIGPKYPGFFENSWIISYGDGNISYYGIPNSVRNELLSISDFGNSIENVAFDIQGGSLLHSVDDNYELQSLVQFQNATPYPVKAPEIKIRAVSGGLELSFPSQINTQYQIYKATSMSTQNWTTDGTPILGNGSIRTVVKSTAGPQGYFKLGDPLFTPTCDQLAYRFYVEPDSETAPGQLTCVFNGSNYQPYNDREDFYIGKFRHGYSQRSSCQTAIDNASPEAVCNWNGNGYSPYNLVNKPETGTDQINIGKPGFGFASFNDCLTVTANAENGAVCNWNGSNYSPYYSKNNIGVGKADFGYNTLSSCVDAVNMSNNKLLCNWNGDGYTPYYVDGTGQVGKEDFGFGSYANCNASVSNSSSYFACNWNGDYTQPYNFLGNVAVNGNNSSFSFRQDCFTTTFKSEANRRVCHPDNGDYSLFTNMAPIVAVPGSSYFFFQQCVDAQ